MRRWFVITVTWAVAIVIALGPCSAAAHATRRTVYVTVVDDAGNPFPGLTPEDFEVKERGRTHEILSVERAREKMRLALMVEESLAAYRDVRIGLGEFVDRMCPVAEISLIVVSFRNRTAVDFTSSPTALIDGIVNLNLSRGQQMANVTEGLFDISKMFERTRPPRPVVVLVAMESTQDSSAEPEAILDAIAKSGAVLSAATIVGGLTVTPSIGKLRDRAGRAQVIGDGTRQSGGRRIEVSALPGIQSALDDIANDLVNQYQIVYALPAGVKPSDRISIKVKRPEAELRAPSRVPVR